jgi:hypothetical protein
MSSVKDLFNKWKKKISIRAIKKDFQPALERVQQLRTDIGVVQVDLERFVKAKKKEYLAEMEADLLESAEAIMALVKIIKTV